MNTTNELLKFFGDKKLFINWTLEQKVNLDGSPKFKEDGHPDLTKTPYRSDGFGRAASTRPEEWTTYENADKVRGQFMGKLGSGGVGIVFPDSPAIVGIDLDHVIVDGKFTDTYAFEFLMNLGSYFELSPSGTGIHAFVEVTEPFNPILNKRPKKGFEQYPASEIYSRSRYFTLTQDCTGVAKNGNVPVRRMTPDELSDVLKDLGYPWHKDGETVEVTQSEGEYVSPIPDNDELLQKMFGSKRGAEIKITYDGGAKDSNTSVEDLKLCGELAYWTGKDKERMRTMWLASKLGQRVKTQSRVDYQNSTLDEAISGCKNVYRPDYTKVIEYDFQVAGENKNPIQNIGNICKVLEKDPKFGGLFRKNLFSHMYETYHTGEWINLLDDVILQTVREIAETHPYFAKVSKDMVQDAIKIVSKNNPVNPPRDYLLALPDWDGKPRIGTWLSTVYGVPEDTVHSEMGSNWIKGLCNRVMNPGCKFDHVLTLVGKQDYKKSMSLVALGEGALGHTESSDNIAGKDFVLTMAAHTIVEWSEGLVFGKELETLKSVITRQKDSIRPPYEHGNETFLRSCVFAATSNSDKILSDLTGNRRFLMVKVEKVADVDYIKENREQMFAEAIQRLAAGETTYDYSDSEALVDLQADSMLRDEYDSQVVRWFKGLSKKEREYGVIMPEMYVAAINPDGKEPSFGMIKRLASIATRMLYLKQANRRIGGEQRWAWFPTDKTIRDFGEGEDRETWGTKEFNEYKGAEE